MLPWSDCAIIIDWVQEMQIFRGFIKMHLKGVRNVCSQVKLSFRFSLNLPFFLSTSLKPAALLEEVRRSPSFVVEDFRLQWKIARHLELSERVRDLSFNFPLSSPPCCMTPSTSQCWCLACLYACCLFVYLHFLPNHMKFPCQFLASMMYGSRLSKLQINGMLFLFITKCTNTLDL